MRTWILVWIACAAAAAQTVSIPVAVVQDKIRGGLLGQMLGDLNGLKHEMKYIAEPGNVDRYLPELPDGAWTDDDTDVEWVYVLEMERTGTLRIPAARIAELWKRHINRRIWCSHLYLRQLVDIGILPPLTGNPKVNPWADFNLSGQFVSETWALISPGMPKHAASLGIYYTHVSVDGEPIQSTQLFDAMIATAFLTRDIQKILDAGVAALDPKSTMYKVVQDVRRWHKENPNDWRTTRRLIKEKYCWYGGQDVRDRNGVVLNGAASIAALLYGNGDFVESVRHAFNLGWDADNNAAMAGTIVGVTKGYKFLTDQGWKIKDVFRNTSRDAMPEDETIRRFGDRLIALAERVIAEQGGRKAGSDYLIHTQKPENVEPLRTPDVKSVRADIDAALAKAGEARSAYLAIALDFAPEMQRRHPEQWKNAVADLQRQTKVMRAIFAQAPVPAGEELRKKMLAAGVQAPEIKK